MRRHRLSAAVAVALILAVLLPPGSSSEAAQVLVNGDFEDGVTGWQVHGLTPASCASHSGSGVLAIAQSNTSSAGASQQIENSAGQGPYTLHGYVKLGGGGPVTLRAAVIWLDAGGAELANSPVNVATTASYQPFAVTSSTGPVLATMLVVKLQMQGTGTVCIDDVTLDGPPPLTATPTPTITLTPIPTDTPTRVPTTARPTLTPKPPTATRVPSATKAPAGPKSSTQASSASAAPVGISEGIVNGGFEEGLDPWRKVGGTLALTSSPAHGGVNAGALSSATSSTKWAYQVVAVGGGENYEFAGFLSPATGVSEAYLRISWYGSADGSGVSIGNTDSTSRLSGGADGFSYLTTGSVHAPDGARSARVRAVMAPVGAGYAALYLDDLAFGPSEAPPRDDAITPASTDDDVTEPSEPSLTDDSAPAAGPGTDPAPLVNATAAPSQEVASLRRAGAAATPPTAAFPPATAAAGRSSHARTLLEIFVAFAAGLGGTLVVIRHWSRKP